MADEVKTNDQTASTGTEVETTDAGASSADTVALLADALAKALEREEKSNQERDNYKEGMLKAKGKISTEEIDGKEKALDANSPELVSAIEKILLRNKELETAAANKSQIATGGTGTSTDTTMKVGDNTFSDDQLKDLKARGFDDAKIARLKANIHKTRA